jgi:hypothetical protein
MHRARRPWLTRSTNLATKFARRLDQQVRPVILDAIGLCLISVAAFHLATAAGYAVSGIACFAMQWRLRDGKSS